MVEPIRGRCRACGARLLLAEVVRVSSGRCPGCGVLLAPGHALLLLEEASRADALQRAFVACLQRLADLPGTLELDPRSVFHNAAAAISWDERLADERRIIRQEAAALRPQVREWRRRPGDERRRAAPAVMRGVHRLAQRLRQHGRLLERRDAEGVADGHGATPEAALAHAAAERLEDAADAVAADRRLADERVFRALDEARASVEPEAEAERA